LRHRVAMDAVELLALSGLYRLRRRARRIQRQIHDQPDGPARLLARDARWPFARDLSQLLLPGSTLAVHRPAPCGLRRPFCTDQRLRKNIMAALARSALRYSARYEAAASESFAEHVVHGLDDNPKWLSAKYFYDAAGSDLFEEITRLPEYYPTRTELS